MKHPLQAFQQWINRRRPRTLAAWLVWGTLAFVVALFVRSTVRLHQVNRFQYAIERKFEVDYFYDGKGNYAPPSPVEHMVGHACQWWIEREPTRPGPGYWGDRSAKIYANPLLSLLHWRVTGIRVEVGAEFTPEAGQALKAFRSLEFFHFDSYTDEDTSPAATASLVKGVASLPRVRKVSLGGPWFKTAHVAELERMPNLEVLILEGVNVDDGCVSSLARFPKLRALKIEGCRISQEGAEKIRAAHPQLILRITGREYTVDSGHSETAWESLGEDTAFPRIFSTSAPLPPL
jgi:hypothetical protein